MKLCHSTGLCTSTLPYPVLVGGADRRALSLLLGSDRPSVTIKVGRTNMDERLDAWKRNFTAKGWDLGKTLELAERFYSVGGTTINRIIERAEAESGGVEPSPEELWAAARECARPEFQGLALHVIPRYKWEDLILTSGTTTAPRFGRCHGRARKMYFIAGVHLKSVRGLRHQVCFR